VGRTSSSFQEQGSEQRFTRTMNPVFAYNFRVGNYLPDSAQQLNPHLLMSIKDITTGVRKSPWFTSVDYGRSLEETMATHTIVSQICSYQMNTTLGNALEQSPAAAKVAARPRTVSPTNFMGGFYNFFFCAGQAQRLPR
jgi:hypothetical protein